MQATTQLLLGADEGETVNLFALGVRYMVESEATDGRFSLVEHPLAPRSLGAPIHTHRNEDEYSYVLEGRVGIQLGDEVVEAGPGELVFKPRGIPHAFWNAGDEECRLLELISPGNFANYFVELAPVLSADGPPDFEALAAIQARYELSMDRDSIGPLAERFGLAV